MRWIRVNSDLGIVKPSSLTINAWQYVCPVRGDSSYINLYLSGRYVKEVGSTLTASNTIIINVYNNGWIEYTLASSPIITQLAWGILISSKTPDFGYSSVAVITSTFTLS